MFLHSAAHCMGGRGAGKREKERKKRKKKKNLQWSRSGLYERAIWKTKGGTRKTVIMIRVRMLSFSDTSLLAASALKRLGLVAQQCGNGRRWDCKQRMNHVFNKCMAADWFFKHSSHLRRYLGMSEGLDVKIWFQHSNKQI